MFNFLNSKLRKTESNWLQSPPPPPTYRPSLLIVQWVEVRSFNAGLFGPLQLRCTISSPSRYQRIYEYLLPFVGS